MKTIKIILLGTVFTASTLFTGCNEAPKTESAIENPITLEPAVDETPDYFPLRPEVEKAFGYSHAVRIGNSIKISGAVSMDDEGNPTAIGDFEQQLKNCYTDLDKILKHYGCTFDDVIVENIFTTDMAKFLKFAG